MIKWKNKRYFYRAHACCFFFIDLNRKKYPSQNCQGKNCIPHLLRLQQIIINHYVIINHHYIP